MNITTQTTALPLATVVNPPTDSLRRDNIQREIITQPSPAQQSAAEKGVASDRERGRTPAQNNEQVDFAAIQENAEKESSTINDANEEERSDSEASQQEAGTQHADHDEHSGEEYDIKAFQEEQQIRELQSRDREVRAHEMAHDAAGGPYTGSPSYGYEVGPDGKKYAVSGEVSVDLSPIEGNPRATIAKMQKVRAAALAPANPSIQDTRVASSAQTIISQAQAQLSELQRTGADEEEQGSSSLEGTRYTGERGTFRASETYPTQSNESSGDFDQFIDQTLASQDQISPNRDVEITQRASRIETFYSNINQAYDKAPKFQFELTA